jgi:hypothetical protein
MQKELNTFKDTIWNSHRIRKQKDAELPAGIPDHMYSFPQEYDMDECGMHVVLINYYFCFLSELTMFHISRMMSYALLQNWHMFRRCTILL